MCIQTECPGLCGDPTSISVSLSRLEGPHGRQPRVPASAPFSLQVSPIYQLRPRTHDCCWVTNCSKTNDTPHPQLLRTVRFTDTGASSSALAGLTEPSSSLAELHGRQRAAFYNFFCLYLPISLPQCFLRSLCSPCTPRLIVLGGFLFIDENVLLKSKPSADKAAVPAFHQAFPL